MPQVSKTWWWCCRHNRIEVKLVERERLVAAAKLELGDLQSVDRYKQDNCGAGQGGDGRLGPDGADPSAC